MPAFPPLPIIFGVSGPHATEEELSFFREVNPFGFILFARNLETPDQIQRLTASLREATGREDVPVLIDEEGGRVQRLPKPQWPDFPAAQTLAEGYLEDPEAVRSRVRENYRSLGAELQKLGITVDAAPVADLAIEGRHEVIGERTFSATPEVVADLARACAEGLRDAGVLPIVKHTPGYGHATVDPHEDLPVFSESLAYLQAQDFAPFQSLADLPWAMTCHLKFPQLDPEWPATLSSAIIQEVIRDWIGFDGLLVTDCLFMKALSGTLPERVQQSLEAGCDVALHSHGTVSEMQAAVARLSPMPEGSWQRWLRSRDWLLSA